MLQPYYLLQLLQKQTDSLMEVSCLEPPPSVPQGNFLSGESHLTAKPLAKQSWRFSHWSFLPLPVPAITQELIRHNAPVRAQAGVPGDSEGQSERKRDLNQQGYKTTAQSLSSEHSYSQVQWKDALLFRDSEAAEENMPGNSWKQKLKEEEETIFHGLSYAA